MLLTSLARSRIAAFECEWGYDMTYARDILASGFGALRALLGIERMSRYRRGIPVAPWFAAKIAAARREDCGPCVQLVVTMAERAKVDPAVLRALLADDAAALPPDVRLVHAFTEATLARAAEADALRDEIVACWGRDALVSIAFSIASARIYPTLKYAFGHGHTCTIVRIAGADTSVAALAR